MSEEKTILAELKERRAKLFEELRDREPERIAKLNELDAAISGINAESGRIVRHDEYSGFRKPSEAINAYLDRVQKPQIREVMCKVLVDGGYGRGTSRPYWDLIRAVDYRIGKKQLVERNGLVGKPDWPKDLFEAKKE